MSNQFDPSSANVFQAADGRLYRITTELLGRGSQGAVYRGQRDDGTDVAIKRIAGGADLGPEKNRELQIALGLNEASRQYLLAPLTWAADSSDLLLVMPLAERSLDDELTEHPEGLAEDVATVILRDITIALTKLRAAGIVHRDLKPANVLLLDGRWHISDFGMSRDLDASTAAPTFTHGGTRIYWAPERWRGLPATHKTDLYSLGCIGHQLVTGNLPFPGQDAVQLQHQHLQVQPPPVPTRPVLARWIMRLLSKEPAERHQDAQAALDALPAEANVMGPLAAAGLQRAQRRQQQEAARASTTAMAEAMTRQRQQALADLGDICTTAAGNARQQLPDVTFSINGCSYRFAVDDVEVALIVWQDSGDNHGAILAGEVSVVANDRRRCAANIVCEKDDTDRLIWFFDRFIQNALGSIGGAAAGFDDNIKYFEHYRCFQHSSVQTSERQRQPLSADVVVNILTNMLQEAI